MDKSKKKRSSHGRKKRLELDGNEGHYSRNHSSSRPPESSPSTRNSTTSRSSAVSSIESTVYSSVTTSSSSRSSNNSLRALPTSCITTDNSNTVTESKTQATKKSILNENGSNQINEGDASTSSSTRPGSASPEPNCAICLGKLENKSFTDSCFHQFCFVCLVEWSKVKAECPLCKQSFKSIVHNVRSYDDYDQYHIPTPEERNSVQELMGQGVRFRYRTTVTDHRYATLADRINREIESRLLQRPSRSLPIPNYRRLRQPANSEFRRSVYLQRLKLNSQQLNTRRRIRETSPTFFRQNPAQTHRLVPWLNRELNALLQGHGEQTVFVLDLILGLIKRFPVDSEEFYQHVLPYIGRHTRQFMHEFLMFAKSPYHMAAYDRHSSYGPSDEPHHDSDSDSDHRAATGHDDNDSDVIVVSPGNSPVPGNRSNQPPPPRREDSNLDDWETDVLTAGDPYLPRFASITRSYPNEDLTSMHLYNGLRLGNAPTSASGWDSPTPGPSQLRLNIPYLEHTSSLTHLSGGSIWTPSQRSFSAPTNQPLPSSGSIFENLGLMPRHPPTSTGTDPSISQEDRVVLHTESDSNSDIEIVEVEKPWTERSPIHVSSGGETDYDVMITGTTHVNDPIKTEKKKKHKRKRDDSSTELNKEKRKRSREKSKDRHSKKKRHLSKSKSPRRYNHSRSRSRTKSLSPLTLRIFRTPGYQHKKFAYKSHKDNSDDMQQYCSSRSASRSRSLSSSDSDSESRVSITSHRRSSKSKHSSIEIVEYRKKSSKLKKKKKFKKNKSKDKAVESNNELEYKPQKHKKRAKLVSEHSTSESHGSRKKHQHKSKKKKHHKDKRQSEMILEEGKDSSAFTDTNDTTDVKKGADNCIFTSDSDPDSASELEAEQISDKSNTDYMVKSSRFGSRGIEFVELDSAQAAVIDQELDSINKTLAKGDYINSLLKDDNDDQMKDTKTKINNNANEIVSPNESLNHRLFKKHPYGHKKSSKRVEHNSFSFDNTNFQEEDSTLSMPLASSSTSAVSKPEDNIQSHDISSCSDIYLERQLPSFLTFSNPNSGFDAYHNALHLFDNPLKRDNATEMGCPTTAACYDSPSSTGLFSGRDNGQAYHMNSDGNNYDMDSESNNCVDVETISDDSEVDITGDSGFVQPGNVATSQSSTSGQVMCDASNFIDVVGDSDDEQTEIGGYDADKTVSEMYSDSEGIHGSKGVDVENSDSDIECSLVEGHKTFEITEDSECENKDEYLKLPNQNSPDIDVIGNSDDEIMIDVDEEGIDTDCNSKENNFSSVNTCAISKADIYFNSDTASASNVECKVDANNVDFSTSDSDTDKYGKPEENIDQFLKHKIRFESAQLREIEPGNSCNISTVVTSQGNGTNRNNARNDADNYDSDKKNEKSEVEQNVTREQKIPLSTDASKGSGTSAEENEDIASSSAQSTGTVERDSDLTLTALYDARPRSTASGDFAYLPRDRTPSWELISADFLASVYSPDTIDGPDWLDRHSPNSHESDFLPED